MPTTAYNHLPKPIAQTFFIICKELQYNGVLETSLNKNLYNVWFKGRKKYLGILLSVQNTRWHKVEAVYYVAAKKCHFFCRRDHR